MASHSSSCSSPGAPGPLHGVRVLDLTTVIMGPAATQMLGDLGADVVKIESPEGDSMRNVGPFRAPAMGPMFLQANRNKRSVVLNLKSAEGLAQLMALAAKADVVVSNIRPQAMKRLGLDYDTLRAVNPRVILCSAVGYGSGGPASGRAVYDDLMQAASGICGLFQQVDGAPRYAPVNLCDRTVGLYVVIAVLAALNHRHATGEGQEIEVPMFETMAQFVLADHMGGSVFAPALGDMGYGRLLSKQRGPYATRDGHLSLVVYTDAHWQTFSALVGEPDLMRNDERFRDQSTRTVHANAVGEWLAQQLSRRSNQEWIALLSAADIPVSVVNSLDQLMHDPHLQAVGLIETTEHPTLGTLRRTRFPVTFSHSPVSLRRPAPALGEHTAQLGEIWADAPAQGTAPHGAGA